MCFVDNGERSAPAAHGPVAGNLVELQTLDGHGHVACDEVERGGFGGAVIKGAL